MTLVFTSCSMSIRHSLPYLFLFFVIFSCKKAENQPVEEKASTPVITATVEANSGLRLRKSPDLDGEKLGLIPDKTLIQVLEISPDRIKVGMEEGNWTKVQWNGLQGWVFGAYLKYEGNQDPGSDAQDRNADFAEPGSVEMTTFNVKNKSFSLGLGCTGRTYSEYESILEVDGSRISITYSHLTEYGEPGHSCSKNEERITEGKFRLEGSVLTASFVKEIAIEREGILPDCENQNEKRSESEIHLEKKFQLVLCDGKRALREVRPPEGLEGMHYLDMDELLE